VGKTKPGAKRQHFNGREDGQKQVAGQIPEANYFHPSSLQLPLT
jgi:hypothetical protein